MQYYIQDMSSKSTRTIIRINSEDTNNGTAMLPVSVSVGDVCYFILNYTQSNYNIVAPASITIGGVTAFVPAGYYTQAGIASELQKLYSTYTISQNTINNTITISNNTTFAFNTATWDPYLTDLMGFPINTLYTGLLTYTSPSSGPGGYKGCGMHMYIDGMYIYDQTDVSTRNMGAKMFIPSINYGTTAQYSDYMPVKWDLAKGMNIQCLNISFRDFYGRTINFNGGSWLLQIIFDGSRRDYF